MLNSPEVAEDRRQRRTADPERAIGFQLEQVVEDFSLDCCVIVDDSGDVVAASPDESTPMMGEFANSLPAMATFPEHRTRHLDQMRRHRPELGDDEVTTCVFRAGGRRYFIGAVGSEVVMNEIAIFRAITGTRRIQST